MMTTEFMCIQIMTDNQGRLKKVTKSKVTTNQPQIITLINQMT